jgi:hypothetical protein
MAGTKAAKALASNNLAVKEAKELIEAGYQYVCDMDSLKLFRKRK